MSMTPVLLAQYSDGTMAPATAKKYAREIAEQEMPKGLSKYVTEEIFPRFGTKVLALRGDGCIAKASAGSSANKSTPSHVKHAKCQL
jgi:hypothetical protein